MRLGLLADIHEDVERLRRAIDALRAQGVDQYVVLGDVFKNGSALEPTVELLGGLSPHAGVWGNHDFGLCGREVSPEAHALVSGTTAAYFAGLLPRMVIDDVYVQHIPPHLDAESIEDLWGGATFCDAAVDAELGFRARPERVLMMGHHHRWLIATPAGPIEWSAEEPIRLARPGRFWVIIGAVMNGHTGVYDTERCVLDPIWVG